LAHKNERVALEMKIMKYRQLARTSALDAETENRITGLIAELEQKLREIDEQGRLSCRPLCGVRGLRGVFAGAARREVPQADSGTAANGV
jgi:hypothetical protein